MEFIVEGGTVTLTRPSGPVNLTVTDREIVLAPDNNAGGAITPWLTTWGWAKLQGVKVSSVREVRVKAEWRRRAGESRPGDMPPADLTIGRSPAWRLDTYASWEANRPGGTHGGRPVNKPPLTAKELRELPPAVNMATAARALQIGEETAVKRAREGTLPVPATKVGNAWVVLKTDLAPYLKEHDLVVADEPAKRARGAAKKTPAKAR